jgi:hypothetical protein
LEEKAQQMDDVAKPIPINIDLADDHYDHKETLAEPVHCEPEDSDDPPTAATAPKAVKAPETERSRTLPVSGS